jgi:hypothetical protein
LWQVEALPLLAGKGTGEFGYAGSKRQKEQSFLRYLPLGAFYRYIVPRFWIIFEE